MNPPGKIARRLVAAGFIFVIVAAGGRAPAQTDTQVGPPTVHDTAETPSASMSQAPVKGDVVETDRGAVVVERPVPKEKSAIGGTMAAIATVITLPFKIILGIFEILF